MRPRLRINQQIFMKKVRLSTKLAAPTAKPDQHTPYGEGDINSFPGNISQGDITDGGVEYGDITDGGPLDVDQGDIDNMMAGAPLARVMAAKVTPGGLSRQQADIGSRFAPPKGLTLSNANIPALIVQNGRIIQKATDQKLNGRLVNRNIKEHRTRSPYVSLLGAKVAALPVEDLIFDGATLFPVTGETLLRVYTVPMVFLTIASSQLIANAGNRYGVQIFAYGTEGAIIEATQWQIERVDITKAIKMTFIPFKRVKDAVKPVLAKITDIATKAIVDGASATTANFDVVSVTAVVSGIPFDVIDQSYGYTVGAAPGVLTPYSFVVRVSNLAVGEQIQGVVPGLDSQELQAFCKLWNIHV